MTKKYFFTSDLHLSHRNILKYCGRPFLHVLDARSKQIVEECWLTEKTTLLDMAAKLSLPAPVVNDMMHTAIELMKNAMNETIIKNWNSVVGPADVVWLVGDIAFEKDRAKLENMLRRLNGEKHIIWGNHDNLLKSIAWKDYFKTGADMRTIVVPAESNNGVAQRIVLCHYAFRVWDQSHYGTWNLHGHSHGTLPDDPAMLQADVGVDVWNFTPVSMEQLNAHMKKKTRKPKDHHGAD